MVECQEERSQHKNRAKALSLLASRLQNAELEKQQKSMAETRKSLVGSGDRSERIRTYNFPQGRVTDHRINLTLYKLDEVIAGDLDAWWFPCSRNTRRNCWQIWPMSNSECSLSCEALLREAAGRIGGESPSWMPNSC